MAARDFEPVIAALYELLKDALADDFGKFTRRQLHFSRLKDVEHPVLILTLDSMIPEERAGLPTKWTLLAGVQIYAKSCATSDEETLDTTLSDLTTKVRAALDAQPGETTLRTLLENKVHRIWIDGPIEICQGEGGGEAGAEMTIAMLVTE